MSKSRYYSPFPPYVPVAERRRQAEAKAEQTEAEQTEADKALAKTSALAKLAALGLTEEEVASILG
jgi:hypothetical protein